MPHVVTERCVDCRYTDCCTVCPVECFYEVTNPAMLVIDPVTCIDCGLCIPECPIYAIYPLAEVPEPYKLWIQKNAELFPQGTMLNVKKDPLPTAVPLEQIHERERAKGYKVADPQAVGGGSGGAAAPAAKKEPKKEAKPAEAPAGAGAAQPLSPKEVAQATIQKKLAAAAPAAAAPATGPAGYRSVPLNLPRPKPRPPLGVHVGGRLRLGHRQGTVQMLRKGPRGHPTDVKILFDGDPKPTWYLYSSLQTFLEQGEVEVLDPGPKPGLLARMFGA